MEIAYLIQAYSDATALKNLVAVLLEMKNCHIFIHLDKKSDINKFYLDNENVHFIDEREFVSWAGYAQGKLIFNLIGAAIKYEKKFDRYCFLSESDFPVYYGEDLYERILNTQTILINCSQNQKHKVEKYWFYDFNIKSVMWNKILSKSLNTISDILYKIHLLKKKSKVLINNQLVDVYCSGPFWQYSYEEIQYIYETFTNNIKFQQYFKHSFASCELMIPTIIANSKYGKDCIYVKKYTNLEALSALCYFRYDGPRVNVLEEADYDSIMASNKPFIRKVNFKSNKLVERLKSNWNNQVKEVL